MPRDYRLYLKDLRASAEKVLRYAGDMTFEEFTRDDKTFDGVVHNLEILSDAAQHVPAEVQARHPDGDWQQLAELRDVALNQFEGVDAHVVWDVVQNIVPRLPGQVREIFAEEGAENFEPGNVAALAKVDSTMLYAIGYDEGTQTLETIFYSGGIYRYFGVPRDIYDGLQAAPSKGRYMWANVINRFPYERVRRRR